MPKLNLLILFSLLVIVVSFSLVSAQDAPVLSKVEVDIWPEFDRPTMLVIYHLTLSSQTRLPAEIAFLIPNSAGSPHAVAVRQPDESLLSVPYSLERQNDQTRVILQATAPEIQLEYYDTALVKENSDRSYTFDWPGEFQVETFVISVQKPRTAKSIFFLPSTFAAKTGSDGLTYYLMNVGPLTQGQKFEVKLSYQKDNDELSYEMMPVAPIEPLDDTTIGFTNLTDILPWILGVLGFTLLFGGAFWYWRSGTKKTGFLLSNPEKPGTDSGPPANPAQDIQYVYCHACGKRASPGDHFCRTCGTALRMRQ